MAAKRPPAKGRGKGAGTKKLAAVRERGSCGACGKSLKGRRGNAKYCDEKCRRDFRTGKRPDHVETDSGFLLWGHLEGEIGSLLESTRDKLAEVDRLTTPNGRAAMKLAARIDVAYRLDSAAGLAAVTKQYHETLNLALDGAAVEGDLVDEFTERRRARLAKLNK